MRRALTILKYVPAVLCGLLVLMWIVSQFVQAVVLVLIPLHSNYEILGFRTRESTLIVMIGGGERHPAYTAPRILIEEKGPPLGNRWLGSYGFGCFVVGCEQDLPIPFFISLTAPIAMLSMAKFRFPLWSYFAWTALVAMELAYYLR